MAYLDFKRAATIEPHKTSLNQMATLMYSVYYDAISAIIANGTGSSCVEIGDSLRRVEYRVKWPDEERVQAARAFKNSLVALIGGSNDPQAEIAILEKAAPILEQTLFLDAVVSSPSDPIAEIQAGSMKKRMANLIQSVKMLEIAVGIENYRATALSSHLRFK